MSDIVLPFGGYNGQVWAKAFAAMTYLSDQLVAQPPPSPSQTLQMAEATFDTFLNGLEAINTSQMANAWNQEVNNLVGIQALPITIDPMTQGVLQTRVATYEAAAAALSALIPVLPFPMITATIPQGQPVIPSAGLLEFYGAFDIEVPPGGTTAATIYQAAAGIATAFTNVANAIIALQGSNLTLAYDCALRQQQVAQQATNVLNDFTSGPISGALPIQQIWNQSAVLPSMTGAGQLILTTPYLTATQQSMVIRYVMIGVIQQLALFILILRSPNVQQISTATLGQGQTLVDLANLVLGDYEQWTDIATVNNLTPPYISANGAPGTTQAGKKLVMPTSGTAASSTGTPPNYLTNFLGVDLFIGQINGQMPPWTGDFQTIIGFDNLKISLGRRLQTTIGTLLFHPEFGSRIPPEVGNIQSSKSAGQIAAFAASAIASDPRIESVTSVQAVAQPNFAIQISASCQPRGFGSTPVSVNEVISS